MSSYCIQARVLNHRRMVNLKAWMTNKNGIYYLRISTAIENPLDRVYATFKAG